eukprot:15334658-Ditylum_brightwellii.AAC.1
MHASFALGYIRPPDSFHSQFILLPLRIMTIRVRKDATRQEYDGVVILIKMLMLYTGKEKYSRKCPDVFFARASTPSFKIKMQS